ncbi:MAG: hypothetical protein R3C01_06765 [Planctomycetaceae bacterium]
MSNSSTFTYDPVGNRLTLDDGLTVTSSTYDAANHLIATDDGSGLTTYTYDADGNQQSLEVPAGDITTSVWNADNQVLSVEQPTGDVTTYTYAPVNRKGDLLRAQSGRSGMWETGSGASLMALGRQVLAAKEVCQSAHRVSFRQDTAELGHEFFVCGRCSSHARMPRRRWKLSGTGIAATQATPQRTSGQLQAPTC